MPEHLLISLLVAAGGGAIAALVRVQGGFGFSLIAFPALAWSVPSTEVRIFLILCELVLSIIIVVTERDRILKGTLSLIPILAGCVLGVGIGHFMLTRLDETWLLWIGLTSALVGGVVLLFRLSVPLRQSLARFLGASISAILGVICSVSGPPLMLVLFGEPDAKMEGVRRSLIIFFFVLYILATGHIFYENSWHQISHWTEFFALTIGAALGVFAGYRWRMHLSLKAWRVIGGVIVIGSCIAVMLDQWGLLGG